MFKGQAIGASGCEFLLLSNTDAIGIVLFWYQLKDAKSSFWKLFEMYVVFFWVQHSSLTIYFHGVSYTFPIRHCRGDIRKIRSLFSWCELLALATSPWKLNLIMSALNFRRLRPKITASVVLNNTVVSVPHTYGWHTFVSVLYWVVWKKNLRVPELKFESLTKYIFEIVNGELRFEKFNECWQVLYLCVHW